MIILIETSKISHAIEKYNTEEGQTNLRNASSYSKLLEDIKKNGMINPLLVVRDKDNTYRVWEGQNRLLVARDLKMDKINCVIMPDGSIDTRREYTSMYYNEVNYIELT